jgi:hypothetical protein
MDRIISLVVKLTENTPSEEAWDLVRVLEGVAQVENVDRTIPRSSRSTFLIVRLTEETSDREAGGMRRVLEGFRQVQSVEPVIGDAGGKRIAARMKRRPPMA